MGHGHGHGGRLTATGRHRSRLVVAFAVSASVLVVVTAGALVSGSLALLADAGHLLADVLALGLALGAATLAARPPSPRRTFGWERVEILAAGADGLLLLGVTGWVAVEGVRRLSQPQHVDVAVMVGTAAVALVANVVAFVALRGGQSESLTVRGAYLEVLGDLLGATAALVAGLVVATTGSTRADAVASLVIAALMAPRAVALLREVGHVLLEGAPSGLDLDHVRAHILEVPGVTGVHDLHAWTITSGRPVLTAHVVVDDALLADGHGGTVLDRLAACLEHHFDVAHSTFQLEADSHRDHEPRLH